ncbi:MAG: hypothetical protein IJI25_08860 [Eubacterium sp.]|nr:hypothetical protein [Eubacterium sp.]
MAKKFDEYNRGRMQGLDMAYRLLRDAGEKKAAELIAAEIVKRGKMPVKLPITSKEIDVGLEQIKWCMYESYMCQTLMVLHDLFGFGKKRCLDFIHRWNLKVDCMSSGLVNWADYVATIKEELDIDVPTACMKEEGLL